MTFSLLRPMWMYLQKVKTHFLLTSCKPLTKRAGSGSVARIRRSGSAPRCRVSTTLLVTNSNQRQESQKRKSLFPQLFWLERNIQRCFLYIFIYPTEFSPNFLQVFSVYHIIKLWKSLNPNIMPMLGGKKKKLGTLETCQSSGSAAPTAHFSAVICARRLPLPPSPPNALLPRASQPTHRRRRRLSGPCCCGEKDRRRRRPRFLSAGLCRRRSCADGWPAVCGGGGRRRGGGGAGRAARWAGSSPSSGSCCSTAPHLYLKHGVNRSVWDVVVALLKGRWKEH